MGGGLPLGDRDAADEVEDGGGEGGGLLGVGDVAGAGNLHEVGAGDAAGEVLGELAVGADTPGDPAAAGEERADGVVRRPAAQ
jgi:hypothetical protein